MSDIYLVEGGLENIQVLHSVPDIPMWIKVPESDKDEVGKLNPARYDIEHVPSKTFHGKDNEVHAEGFYIVKLKRPSFNATVNVLLQPLLEEGVGSRVDIESRGKIASERATIHNAASELGIKVSVQKSGGTFIITHVSKSAGRREPNWWSKVRQCKGLPVTLKFNGRFTSFRSKVYTWAKRKGHKITVVNGDGPNEAVVTYTGYREPGKSVNNTQRFNDLIYSLPYDTPSDVPEWLSSKSDATIRVMCSNHPETLSYRGGKLIRYAPPTTHRSRSDNTDNTGDFVYDGRNYGPRTDKWIEIFMKSRGEK